MNGVLITSNAVSITPVTLGSISTGYVGRPPNGLTPDNYMDGWIKDFKVYNYELRSVPSHLPQAMRGEWYGSWPRVCL